MSETICLSASIVADTIMRTIELGVTITDATLDDQVTGVFCDLVVDGPDRCPSCSQVGTYRDTIVRTVTDLPLAGPPLQLRVRASRYRCENVSCDREGSGTTPLDSHVPVCRPPADAPGTSCAG